MTQGPLTKGKAVSIESAPLRELLNSLIWLKPSPEEIWGYAYRLASQANLCRPLPPGRALDKRVAVRRRSWDYFPPELRVGPDGGVYIQVGGEGVELHLDEKDAMNFINYIVDHRRAIEDFCREMLKRGIV